MAITAVLVPISFSMLVDLIFRILRITDGME